jgi:hypothetical protein
MILLAKLVSMSEKENGRDGFGESSTDSMGVINQKPI